MRHNLQLCWNWRCGATRAATFWKRVAWSRPSAGFSRNEPLRRADAAVVVAGDLDVAADVGGADSIAQAHGLAGREALIGPDPKRAVDPSDAIEPVQAGEQRIVRDQKLLLYARDPVEPAQRPERGILFDGQAPDRRQTVEPGKARERIVSRNRQLSRLCHLLQGRDIVKKRIVADRDRESAAHALETREGLELLVCLNPERVRNGPEPVEPVQIADWEPL